MIQSSLDPLVHSVEVNCSQSDAFELWAFRPSSWWPMKDHSTFGENSISVVIEPGTGGRIYETDTAGSQREWGRITDWSPPSGMSFTWHIYGSSDEATDVEVKFDQVNDERTRVTVIHSGWERIPQRAAELREGNRVGWIDLLEAFSTATNRQSNRE